MMIRLGNLVLQLNEAFATVLSPAGAL